MPIYEFECEGCGEHFEELVSAAAATEGVACPACAARRSRRLFSPLSPPSRQPRGAKVRASEAGRREREGARQERIADSRAKRAAGESVRPAAGGAG